MATIANCLERLLADADSLPDRWFSVRLLAGADRRGRPLAAGQWTGGDPEAHSVFERLGALALAARESLPPDVFLGVIPQTAAAAVVDRAVVIDRADLPSEADFVLGAEFGTDRPGPVLAAGVRWLAKYVGHPEPDEPPARGVNKNVDPYLVGLEKRWQSEARKQFPDSPHEQEVYVAERKGLNTTELAAMIESQPSPRTVGGSDIYKSWRPFRKGGALSVRRDTSGQMRVCGKCGQPLDDRAAAKAIGRLDSNGGACDPTHVRWQQLLAEHCPECAGDLALSWVGG